MNSKRIPVFVLLGILVCSAVLALFALPASARPSNQAYYYTPTPGADGKIIYIVRDNDSCLSIALKNGASGDQIASLNALKPAECAPGATLEPGRQLILAVVEILPTPTLTNTPSGPTPTPFNGTGKACFILFEDLNENGMQDTGEGGIANGVVGVVLPEKAQTPYEYFTIPSSSKPASATTSAENQPECIDEIPEGDYILVATLPEGYRATTNMIFPAPLTAGQTLLVRFGAVPPNNPPPDGGGSKGGSALPLIFGGFLLLAGAGLGAYLLIVRRINRQKKPNE
jgi:hypothetical protein